MMGMLFLGTCFSVAQNKTQSTTNTETSKVQKKSTQQLFKETYRNQNRRNQPVFQAWVTDPDPTGTNVRQTPNGVVMRIGEFEAFEISKTLNYERLRMARIIIVL